MPRLTAWLLEPPNISVETDTMDSIGKITALIKDAMAEQIDLHDSGDDAAIEDNKALLTSLHAKRSKLMDTLVVWSSYYIHLFIL